MRGMKVFIIGAVLALLAASAQADLIALYRFDNSANLGEDSGSLSNDLTYTTGATSTTSGKYGGAAYFNGSSIMAIDASLTIPTGCPTGDSSYTFAAWVQVPTEASSVANGLYGMGSYGANGQVNATWVAGTAVLNYWWGGYGDVQGNASGSLTDSTWHYIAVTYDNTTGQRVIYADGNVIANPTTDDANVAGHSFVVGCAAYNVFNQYLNGNMDDFAMFNEALSSTEISTIMSGDFSAYGVPEPATMSLLGIGGLGLLIRRKRK